MTRRQVIALRDCLFQSLCSQLKPNGAANPDALVNVQCTHVMGLMHKACCAQLASMQEGMLDAGERTELTRIADSLELLHIEDDAQQKYVIATIDEIRTIAARGDAS